MPMPSLPIIRTCAIVSLSHRSARAGAAWIVRVLGFVARAPQLDTGRIVRAVARLSNRDAAECGESENCRNHDLHQSCHRLPPCLIALRG
jgi:hypothetical protein